MVDCPRIAIVAYGSILNPDDLRDLFHDIEDRVLPIKVKGFKRVFNQEASWRDIGGNQRAVLNVFREDNSWFNGLVVADITRAEFEEFRDREQGYRLVEIEQDQIEAYEPQELNTRQLGVERSLLKEQDLALVTTGKKTNSDIAPIESYVRICLDGAKQWGDEFLADFKSTTELNSGHDLDKYLND